MSLNHWLRRSPAPPAIALDFVPQRRWPNALGWLLLVTGLLGSLSVLLDYRDLGAELAAAQNRLARETRHLDRARREALDKSRETVPEAQLRSAVELARLLQGRNLDVLTDLERVGSEDIGILSLNQSARDQQLKLTGQARSLKAAFDFARALAARPGMLDAQINSYEFKQVGSVEAVAFTLNARWQEAP
jgi:Tfp pilus assembly protein PilN